MRNFLLPFLLLLSPVAFSQHVTGILVRHDTTLLVPSECKWIIKSAGSQTDKSVSFIILQAIEKGKIKAVDPLTNKVIPGNKIYTWHMPTNTSMVYDSLGNSTYKTVQSVRKADDIIMIRMYQDWYFNEATGKLYAVPRGSELMEEVRSPATGEFIGYRVLCWIDQ